MQTLSVGRECLAYSDLSACPGNIATEVKLWYRTRTPVSVVAGDGGCTNVT
jgi:hypothetical protein